VESLVRDFELYGSVQGSAVGHIQMKCIDDVDEAARLAAEAVQLKPLLASPPSSTAVAAASVPRSINSSTIPSFCKYVVSSNHSFLERSAIKALII